MSLAELTGVLAGTGGFVTALGALYAALVKARRDAAKGNTVSWQSFTKTLYEERDQLRAQLRAIDDDYRKRTRELEADYLSQLQAAKQRISQLEKEVEDLYIRLGRAGK